MLQPWKKPARGTIRRLNAHDKVRVSDNADQLLVGNINGHQRQYQWNTGNDAGVDDSDSYCGRDSSL